MSPEIQTPIADRKPSLDENFALMELWANRVGQDIDDNHLDGTFRFPPSFYDCPQETEIVSRLKEEGADLTQVPRYLELVKQKGVLVSRLTNDPRPVRRAIEAISNKLGADILGKAISFEPEDGVLHETLAEEFEDAIAERESPTTYLSTLKHAYGCESATGLLGVKTGRFAEKLKPMIRNDMVISAIRREDETSSVEEPFPKKQEAALDWMSSAISLVTGIGPEEARNYTFSASRRVLSEDFIKALSNIEHFGIERIRGITRATGIYGIEGYNTAQLERMEEFANNPSGMAAKLANNDTVTIFTNRTGDRNGVFRTIAEDYDDDTGRVLFFEFSSLCDMARRVDQLNMAGIRPSTVVLAAHSSPGEFIASDLRDPNQRRMDVASIASSMLVRNLNTSTDTSQRMRGYSIGGIRGSTARMVEAFMQPSRSLDDDAADKGRKKLIFHACYSATEEPPDKNAAESGAGDQLESVISSLGESVLKMGVSSNVDIYGAPTEIQVERNDAGVHYTVYNKDSGTRVPTNAIRIRIEDGILSKEETSTIVLRRAA